MKNSQGFILITILVITLIVSLASVALLKEIGLWQHSGALLENGLLAENGLTVLQNEAESAIQNTAPESFDALTPLGDAINAFDLNAPPGYAVQYAGTLDAKGVYRVLFAVKLAPRIYAIWQAFYVPGLGWQVLKRVA